ncbi:hypothetical protein EON77_21340 [bacterium]|nr:MAG: hypothetical protein EON77_21340 [bacterium]
MRSVAGPSGTSARPRGERSSVYAAYPEAGASSTQRILADYDDDVDDTTPELRPDTLASSTGCAVRMGNSTNYFAYTPEGEAIPVEPYPDGRTGFRDASGRHYEAGACFVAGTPVATPSGEKPIEQIEPGDYVLAAAGEDTGDAGADADEGGPRAGDLPTPPHPSSTDRSESPELGPRRLESGTWTSAALPPQDPELAPDAGSLPDSGAWAHVRSR